MRVQIATGSDLERQVSVARGIREIGDPCARMHRADSSILPKPACREPDDDLEPLVPDEAAVVVEPMLATFGSEEPLPHPPRPRAWTKARARATRLTTLREQALLGCKDARPVISPRLRGRG